MIITIFSGKYLISQTNTNKGIIKEEFENNTNIFTNTNAAIFKSTNTNNIINTNTNIKTKETNIIPEEIKNSYTNYSIEDTPWTDEKDISLELGGGGQIEQNINKYGYKYFNNFDINAGRNEYDNAIFGISLSPVFHLKNITLSQSLTFHLLADISSDINNNPSQNDSYEMNSIQTRDTINYENTGIGFSLHPSFNYTIYFNNFFIGSMSSLSFYYNSSEREQESKNFDKHTHPGDEIHIREDERTYNNSQDSHSILLRETIKIGIGRTYQGSYSYYVMQIVDDLKDRGLLLKTVKSKDMKELSRIIAKERKKYRLDDREAIIDVVEKISKYLIKHKYIKPDDAKSILIIDDTYRYMPGYYLYGNRYPSYYNPSRYNIYYFPYPNYPTSYSRTFGKTYNLRIGGYYYYRIRDSEFLEKSTYRDRYYTNNIIRSDSTSTSIRDETSYYIYNNYRDYK